MLFILFSLFSSIFANLLQQKEPLTFKFYSQTPNILKTPLSFMEIPEIPVETSQEIDRDYLVMCFGKPSHQCFRMVIHSGSFHMWIADGGAPDMSHSPRAFNMNMSNSIERNKTSVYTSYHDNFVSGYIGRDYLYLSEQKITKITFMLAEKTNSFTGYEGMIGLGYTPNTDEEQFSFLHQLFQKEIIFHRVFTQTFKTSSNGEIGFGSIPKHIAEDYKHYGRCPALDKIVNEQRFKNKNWQCKLRAIYFGKGDQQDPFISTKIMADSKVSFFSYRRRALLPKAAMSYLLGEHFGMLIEEGICDRKMIKRYETILCKKDYINEKDFFLMFDNWGMKIPKDKVFFYNEEENKKEFIFSYKKDYEKWSLGRPIVRLFDMVYDYENKEIGFYSKDNVISLSTKEPEPVKEYEEVIDAPGPRKTKIGIEYSQYIPAFKDDDNEGKIIQDDAKPTNVLMIFTYMLKTVIFLLISIILYVVISSYLRFTKTKKSKNAKVYSKFQENPV